MQNTIAHRAAYSGAFRVALRRCDGAMSISWRCGGSGATGFAGAGRETQKSIFSSSWASYETAKPDSFKLLPPSHREAADVFGDAAKFHAVLRVLGEAERKINHS